MLQRKELDMAGLNLNAREFQRVLKKNGFVYNHQTGDHRIWYRNSQHISVNIRKLNYFYLLWKSTVGAYKECKNKYKNKTDFF